MSPGNLSDFAQSNQHIISLTTIATVTALIGAYLYYRKATAIVKIPKNWIRVARVKQLCVYPLKSGRRRELDSAECTKVGLCFTENNVELRDRYFIAYGEDTHEFRTARTFPKLVLIETSINSNGDVVFTAPGQNPLIVKLPNSESKLTTVRLHNQAPVEALDCGNEAGIWFSRFLLDKPSGIRLGYYRSQFRRNIKKQFPKRFHAFTKLRVDSAGIYSDLTSYHLLSESSIQALNTELETPVTANNFRGNIIVESKYLKAYAEEDWDWVRIGDAIFKNVKPCTRCIFTTVDPETGTFSNHREPMKCLERINGLKEPAHINCEGKKGVMGIHLELWKRGHIQVGDEVLIA
ncbi:molybdopterin cofactor sulfurase mosc [Holotrichia oblita]|uniref:Molybdopterin cofactor sulfurase mosc n=1 Tax=Holotrichia oblita TaxID=644536 RepID=A0ACB9STG7_HOLOL|nr:molybdopterin cofactor sulfurase mosc [Holotrichia oblita]